MLFFRKGKVSGLAVHFKSDIYQAGQCDHLGWHSDFIGFTPAERRSAEYQFAVWLKASAKRGLSVLMDPVPGPYYKFNAAIGLSVFRVRVERLAK